MTDKEKFWELLEAYPPRVQQMWDRERDEHLGEGSGFSSGEAVMHEALKAIWYGTGVVELTDLANLADEHKEPLLNWLKYPFWP